LRKKGTWEIEDKRDSYPCPHPGNRERRGGN